MITGKDFNILAQKAHFLGGLAAVWGSAVLFSAPIYGAIGITVFAVVKEFWYDQHYETPEIRGSNSLDFLFYVFGAGIALTTCLLK